MQIPPPAGVGMEIEGLIERAKESRKRAYAPYSGFKVGAVIVTEEGKIYEGANIENASYGLTICAERVALFKAVSEGERRFSAIVIYTHTDEPTYPCGACLQTLSEFTEDLRIIIAYKKGKVSYNLYQLLPKRFMKPHSV